MLRARRAWLVSAILAGVSGCGSSPAAPTYAGHFATSPSLQAPACTPVQTEVHCTAATLSQGVKTDVTNSVTWFVGTSNLSVESASSDATVTAPGVIVPVRPGNISIQAGLSPEWAPAAHTYAIDPAAPAVALAPYLSGGVGEVDGGVLSGVLVEVIDGEFNVGKTDQTRSNGAYFILHMRMGVPFTVRASKPGYVSVTQTHPGITDNASGYPANTALQFKLARAPSG